MSSRSDTPDTPVSLVTLFPDGLRSKRIHAVGAGGSGISAVLRLAAEQGALVTGCDVAETTMSKLLNTQGVQVTIGHDPAHVAGCDLVVTTPAVTFLNDQHLELVAARKQGIPVIHWQELLGYLMRDSVGVSVAGVHGKGSTTALLSALAIAGGLDPTVEVGAVVSDWDTNLYVGAGRYFINEADEFNYNFLNYHPRVVALTAVEFDHPEFFADYTAIRDAFVRFLRGMDLSADSSLPPPALALNADSPGCLDTLLQLGAWPGQVRTFALEAPDAYTRAEDIRDDTETSFTLHMGGRALGRVTLNLPGRHNIANALAAATTAELLGADPETFVPALNEFGGLLRRFQVIADGDVTFIDDYAHHPHAVALTLETTRRRFPGRRIVAVFQPTLYTRLHRFLALFSEAFDTADMAIIVEVQPSREHDTGLIHGRDLVAKIAERPAFADRAGAARYGGDLDETATLLREIRQPGDVVVVMGSGPVNQVITLARKETEQETEAGR
ncbi:MAG TPA: UDP-N-acetylmuramate--L-alanine ligase [Ktedonobacterales bacterium]|jgi:UDP-N-acetylmuramate--alanine ligase